MSQLISLTTYGGRLTGLDDQGQVWEYTSKNIWRPMPMDGLPVARFNSDEEETTIVDPDLEETDPEGTDKETPPDDPQSGEQDTQKQAEETDSDE